MLLKDTAIGKFLPKSTFVGIGITNEEDIKELLDNYSKFIMKPILGHQGRGFRVLTRDEIEEFRFTRGPIKNFDFLDAMNGLYSKKPRIPYIEDLVEIDSYSFEKGISIIQPFVDSKGLIDSKEVYTSVRAIICNGEFVDAYKRVDQDPKVNFSQGAKPYPFKQEGFREFCEEFVKIFLEESSKYNSKNFKKELYNLYFERRGKTTDQDKIRDINRETPDIISIVLFRTNELK